jgi:subtilase family serine protease
VSAATRFSARGLAVALLAGTFSSGASAAPGPHAGSHPAARAKTRYARIRRVCPSPRRGRATCFALVREPVAASTAGAAPFVLNDGASQSGPAGGLTPAQLASAYEYAPNEGGTGQTVAIADAFDDPKIEADLGTFDSQYGLSACTTANGCFKKTGQTGSTTELPKVDKEGWSLEISLDVEAVHGACPNCKILLVEANEPTDADLAAAVNEAVKLGATEVSNSYGGPEEAADEAAYNHPGVVITASAGDGGYYDWDVISEGFAAPERPESPASLPTVVAAGGTSLKLNENGTRNSESVWNDSGRPSHEEEFKQYSATGGGCSTLFTAPSWQQNVPGWTNTACGTKRLDNDISAVADPYTGFDVYDSYNCGKTCEKGGIGKGWVTIGGTSLSSPLLSALYALAGGGGGVGYPAATLYSHLGQTPSLYDVTEGGNGYCDGEAPGPCGEPEVNELLGNVDCEGTTACDAATGFDGPSGVGAPKGLGAFKSNAITFLTQTSATLNARVNPDGQTVTECEFEYGTSTKYGSKAPCKSLPGSGTSPVAVSANVTALTPNTEYHFRVVTLSSGGTTAGVDVTFKTLKVAAPSVETKAATGAGETSATLNASVNPRGDALSVCTFEYGTTASYGSSVPCSALPGSGSSPVAVSASITAGLTANTEYHVRFSATNTAGTTKGADVTFKTS